MEELIIEMERLKSEKKKLDREKSAKKMYEIKVKETAKELTGTDIINYNFYSNFGLLNIVLIKFQIVNQV